MLARRSVLSSTLILALFLTNLFHLSLSDTLSQLTPDRNFVNSDHSSDGITSYDYWQKVAYGNGVWIAVWNKDRPGGAYGSDSDIFYSRSLNNGLTWSTMQCLAPYCTTDSGTDQGPRIVFSRNVWTVVWHTNVSNCCGATKGIDFDLIFSNSQDDGLTWSPPKVLDNGELSDFGAADVWASLAANGQGTVVMVFTTTRNSLGTLTGLGSDYDIVTAYSDNDGVTWSIGGLVNSYGKTDNASSVADEYLPDIAFTKVGGVDYFVVVFTSLWNFNNKGNDDDLLSAYSTDKGGTWSALSILGAGQTDDVSAKDYEATIAADFNGMVMVAWYGTSAGDMDVFLQTSVDGGATWGNFAMATSYMQTDSDEDSSPQISTDKIGHWVLTWDSLYKFGVANPDDDYDVLWMYSNTNAVSFTAPQFLMSNQAADTNVDSDYYSVLAVDTSGNTFMAMYEHATNDSDLQSITIGKAQCYGPSFNLVASCVGATVPPPRTFPSPTVPPLAIPPPPVISPPPPPPPIPPPLLIPPPPPAFPSPLLVPPPPQLSPIFIPVSPPQPPSLAPTSTPAAIPTPNVTPSPPSLPSSTPVQLIPTPVNSVVPQTPAVPPAPVPSSTSTSSPSSASFQPPSSRPTSYSSSSSVSTGLIGQPSPTPSALNQSLGNSSGFTHTPPAQTPFWAWILIAIGILIVLVSLAAIIYFKFIRKEGESRIHEMGGVSDYVLHSRRTNSY